MPHPISFALAWHAPEHAIALGAIFKDALQVDASICTGQVCRGQTVGWVLCRADALGLQGTTLIQQVYR